MVLEKTLESPLDFKEIQPVHPKGAVAVSVDGVNFTEVASQTYEVEEKAENCLMDLVLTFPEVTAKYVKLTFVPLAKMPEWRQQDGNAAYAFIDEIIVK